MDSIVKSEPFHIQAYKNIQRTLLEKEFSPGEQLTETSLAKKLGISRGPVREAIRMLLHDGLLVQKGVHVYVFDPQLKDVLDLYLCKERLEPLGARLAASNIDEPGIKELNSIISKTESALSNKSDNKEIASLNTDFHSLISKYSQNQQLIQFMNLIRAKNIYMRNVLLGDFTRKENFIDEHKNIADAIINRNPDAAETLMKEHIKNDLDTWKIIFNDQEGDEKL
ncbi:GntR family transcriptional regulator [Piscibacillus halophilus]|uniref:Transcriptional regulator, GntR family n=1 Tax=Piscibacillus halophilus TaxID=571933 RepID=A0A1H9I7U5_9BACI|nr:GntR family transcriptional regulator [Piscibacillus halophilus]SEQ70663.1 transcriptional regulator, GntR family [Piscibacillus halophilus]